jgi:hypothetical protein
MNGSIRHMQANLVLSQAVYALVWFGHCDLAAELAAMGNCQLRSTSEFGVPLKHKQVNSVIKREKLGAQWAILLG